MNLITIRQLPNQEWRASAESDTYESGRGLHLPELQVAFGDSPQMALVNLLLIQLQKGNHPMFDDEKVGDSSPATTAAPAEEAKAE